MTTRRGPYGVKLNWKRDYDLVRDKRDIYDYSDFDEHTQSILNYHIAGILYHRSQINLINARLHFRKIEALVHLQRASLWLQMTQQSLNSDGIMAIGQFIVDWAWAGFELDARDGNLTAIANEPDMRKLAQELMTVPKAEIWMRNAMSLGQLVLGSDLHYSWMKSLSDVIWPPKRSRHLILAAEFRLLRKSWLVLMSVRLHWLNKDFELILQVWEIWKKRMVR